MRVLVTGASGFVGRSLCNRLYMKQHTVIAAVRCPGSFPSERVIPDLTDERAWRQHLPGIQTVVHLAARVHVMKEREDEASVLYRTVNTTGTMTLARAAARCGVRRLVFVSTIKVNGESSARPFRPSDLPFPSDPYARSKWEAEQALHDIARETGLEVVVLRPPLIYGPGVGANFRRLMHAIDRGWPLPLGGVHNLRSLLYVDNLCDAIASVLEAPAAVGKTYLPADGEDISTPELIVRLADAMGKPPKLISVRPGLLHLLGRLTGRAKQVDRLLGSLRSDSRSMSRDLNWTPPWSMEEGLKQTADWYNATK
jgi:nucleoside-diphosphate-sugar epimerase